MRCLDYADQEYYNNWLDDGHFCHINCLQVDLDLQPAHSTWPMMDMHYGKHSHDTSLPSLHD